MLKNEGQNTKSSILRLIFFLEHCKFHTLGEKRIVQTKRYPQCTLQVIIKRLKNSEVCTKGHNLAK